MSIFPYFSFLLEMTAVMKSTQDFPFFGALRGGISLFSSENITEQ